MVSKYDWSTDTALAVMQAESGCREDAFNGSNSNGSNDAGLMQINSIHVRSGLISDADRYNAELNIKAAYAIYQGSGWRAWSAYNAGKHLQFL